ncbi:MAG: hypothetical protein IPK75_18810 [Acidobacteria bacterium]|nr:hypothetical protein [Acidobacteriota bacterium]
MNDWPAGDGNPNDYVAELCGDDLWTKQKEQIARAKRWQDNRFRQWWMRHEVELQVWVVLPVGFVLLVAAAFALAAVVREIRFAVGF